MSKEEIRYRLWWELLKRSRAYRIFCEVTDQKDLEKEFIPVSAQEKIVEYFTGERRKDFEKQYDVNINEFMKIYSLWGDVHQNDFEYWWGKRGKQEISKSKTVIVNVRDDLKTLSNLAQLSLLKSLEHTDRRAFGLEDMKEMVDLFRNYFSSPNNPQYLYLKVDIHSKSTSDEIGREIARFRTEQKKESKIGAPTTRLREEVEQYLKVYDEKERNPEESWADIIKNTGYEADKEKFKEKSVQEKFIDYWKKAKILIKQVEHNHFPGNE